MRGGPERSPMTCVSSTISMFLRFQSLGHFLQHFVHTLRIDQKFPGGYGAAAADAGCDDHQLLDIGIHEARHNA